MPHSPDVFEEAQQSRNLNVTGQYADEADRLINQCRKEKDIDALIQSMRQQASTLTTYPSADAYAFGVWMDEFAERLAALEPAILKMDRKAS